MVELMRVVALLVLWAAIFVGVVGVAAFILFDAPLLFDNWGDWLRAKETGRGHQRVPFGHNPIIIN